MHPVKPVPPVRTLPSLVTLIEIALLIAAAIFAADGLVGVANHVFRRTNWLDFQVYYLSARMLELASPVYPSPPAQTLGVSLDLTPMVYNYPPFFTVLLRPFAFLPYHLAGTIWMVMGLGFLAASVLILSRRALYCLSGKSSSSV